MSQKNKDNKNRWRNKTVAFRMSPEEAEMLDRFVMLSGYTKQDYIISRLLQRDIVVNGNPRTYKALRNQMIAVLAKLEEIRSVNDELEELLILIAQINTTLYGFGNSR